MNNRGGAIVLACLCFMLARGAAAEIFKDLPKSIVPSARYIFYSHGYIVEGNNTKPEHPRWGVYDYPAILAKLDSLDATVVAEHRAANTDPFAHARKLERQVRQLLENGVPAANITLIGFSRGGFITAVSSHMLANREINTVILAACTSGLAKHSEIALHGHILSVYETSDTVGSCAPLAQRSGITVSSFTEVAITTGKEHGAFYRPLPQWLEPLSAWMDSPKVDSELPEQ